MGRPKGSKNRPKNTEPPVPDAEMADADEGVTVEEIDAAPPAKGSVVGDNAPPPMSDDEVRAIFLGFVRDRIDLTAAKTTAKKEYDAAVSALRHQAKTIKKAGICTLRQVEKGMQLQTPEGEASLRDEMAENLQAAIWIGSPIGTQFSFDLDGDRRPIEDRAFDAGKIAFMSGERADPPHSPETAAFRAWLRGYHEAQGAAVAAGIRPLEDDDTTGTLN